jgi:predicted amidohydrolase
MKVAFVQFNPQFGMVNDNIAAAESLIARVRAELYVLPELCFTGYTFKSKEEAQSLSEPADNGFSINEMKRISADLNAAIVFGFPERSGADLFNSCALVLPDGQVFVYRKIHLFMHEKEWFKPGDKPFTVHEFNGCRIGLMICFDWRFPEAARALALRGAHLICHPSNLVHPHCQAAMVTRCLENRIFAVTANRHGSERRGPFENTFTGKSQIVNPKGDILVSATNDKDEICFADINYRESEDKEISPNNNLWGDRRPEFYYREDYG